LFSDLTAESTLKFVAKAKSLAKEVKANLGLGEPDKPPPRALVELLKDSTKLKPTYTPSGGLKEAREAVAEWLSKRYGADVGPEEVMITPSGKAALFLALSYASTRYSSAKLFDPTYYSYEPVLKAWGVSVEKVGMIKGELSYEFPEIEVGREVVVVNTPANPTGAVLGERLLDLVGMAAERGGLVVSDEPYDVFVYEGKHYSVLQHEKWREAAIYVYSFSKILSVPGWRLGALVAEKEVIKKLSAAASNVYGCPCKWEQVALARYLREHPEDLERHVSDMVSEYSRRRDMVVRELEGVASFVGVGRGSFYAFPEFEADGEELALELAKRGVIVIPGSVFSPGARRNLRISYSAPLEELRLGLGILKEVVKEG